MSNEFGQRPQDAVEINTEVPLVSPWDSSFRLTTNPTVEDIATKLHTATPDWEKLYAKINHRKVGKTHTASIGAHLSEAFVNEVIEVEALQGDHAGAINIDPIPDGEERGGYRYERDRFGNMTVSDTSTGDVKTEVDFYLEAGELPVIGEVRARANLDRGAKSFSSLMTGETVVRKVGLFQHYYEGREEFGYVVAGPRDVFVAEQWEKEKPSSLYLDRKKQFTDHGGIVVELPFDIEELNDRARNYLSWRDRLPNQDIGAQLRDKFPHLFPGT